MRRYNKKDFPVDKARQLLEPGPIVLVSSAWKGERNIMTMGWHMMLDFQPSLLGCYIWEQNHSFELIKKSKQCVINVPSSELAETVVRVGNCSGREVDKFEHFGLTAVPAETVGAPLIAECYASFECRLVDSSLIKKYRLFVFELTKAHKATTPKFPETMHYRGDGQLMISGATTGKYRKLFKPQNL